MPSGKKKNALQSFDELPWTEQKQHLSLEDQKIFEKQRDALKSPPPSFKDVTPFSPKMRGLNKEKGEELLRQGKCALLVLAGGSGSRLKFDGPKGCFPISVIQKKTLFQMLCEKVKYASSHFGAPLEVAIMTNPLNHEETVTFFYENHYFGLNKNHLHFFSQELFPLLTEEGKMFLESEEKIATGPNGNGRALHALIKSGIYQEWKKRGIEIVNVVPIDNPLAPLFDPLLFHEHIESENDITVVAVKRKDPYEKVGILVSQCQVVEYTECFTHLEASAYIGLFCISLSCIEEVTDFQLPLHKVKKRMKGIKGEIEGWKFEYFLFDLFPHFTKVNAIAYPREECFAPLKNCVGEGSIESVHKALMEMDRKTFYRVTGMDVSLSGKIELSQNFYYPTEDLIECWERKGKPKEGYLL